MSFNVFVYGTLLFPEVTDRLGIHSNSTGTQPCPLVRSHAKLWGFSRFTVRLSARGNYPAIIPSSSSSSVQGQLLRDVSADALKLLDQFEGLADRLYERIEVTVSTAANETDSAYTYVCGPRLIEFLEGPWDELDFKQHDLDWYVANLA